HRATFAPRVRRRYPPTRRPPEPSVSAPRRRWFAHRGVRRRTCAKVSVLTRVRVSRAAHRTISVEGRGMTKAVIVSAARTAIGTLSGSLAQQPATKLGAVAVREDVKRAKLEPGQVDEVILGHELPAALGLNHA